VSVLANWLLENSSEDALYVEESISKKPGRIALLCLFGLVYSFIVCSPALHDLCSYATLVAQCSLSVLKVPLNTNQWTNHPVVVSIKVCLIELQWIRNCWFQMDHSGEHVRDVFSALYKYHLDNFLCDVVITTASGSEVHAHSIVLSAVCFVHVTILAYGQCNYFMLAC